MNATICNLSVLPHFLTALLIGIALSSQAFGEESSPRRFALLVGVNGYSRQVENGFSDLETGNDLRLMAAALRSKFGFQQNEIKVLWDDPDGALASNEEIESEFKAMVVGKPEKKNIKHHFCQFLGSAGKGDQVVFYFAGHGQQLIDDDPEEENDRLDESLIPLDYTGNSASLNAHSNIRDDELQEWIEVVKNRMTGVDGHVEGTILILIDCCHAGSITRGSSYRGRGWSVRIDGEKPEILRRTTSPRRQFLSSNARIEGYSVLTATAEHKRARQEAYEDASGKISEFGVFTYHLARHLDASINYRTLEQRLDASVFSQVGAEQDPTFEGDPNRLVLGDSRFISSPIATKDHHLEGTAVLCSVNYGFLHGATKGSKLSLFDPMDTERAKIFAEGIVTKVGLSNSTILLTPKEASVEYLANRGRTLNAVVVEHAFEDDRLSIRFDSVGPEELGLSDFDFYKENTTADFVVAKEGELVKLKDLAAPTNDRNWEIEDADMKDQLRRQLMRAWRWRFLSSLQNDSTDSIRLEVQIAPVTVNYDEELNIWDGNLNVVENESEQRVSIKKGDFAGIKVRIPANEREQPLVRREVASQPDRVFVNVIELDMSGRIKPIFPHPKAYGTSSNSFPLSDNWKLVPGHVFRMTKPALEDLSATTTKTWVAIATKETA